MTYTALFWQLHLSPSPITLFGSLTQSHPRQDKSAVAAAIGGLREAVRRNRQDHAISAGRTLLVLAGPEKAISRIKREGVLRASSFAFHAPSIALIVGDWIDHAAVYGITASDVGYLKSVSHLCRLAPAVRTLYRDIVERLRAGQAAVLKSLLAEVDASFANNASVDVGFGEERSASREELAEAFSYLLHLFDAHVGLNEWHFALTDIDADSDSRFRILLGDALKLCRYREAEDYESVPHRIVAGTITVLDLYKVQRVFRFIHHGIKRAIDRHEPADDRGGMYRASCLPVLSRERALFAFGLAVGGDKAAEVLALLTADPKEAGLDIQDAPVIAADGYFMVSPAVLANSNLPRNILSRLHQRLVPAAPGKADPMQSQLADALREAGFLVALEFNLRVGKGDKLETDILAYRDGHLFVFECKNAYHPCNVYEMRNTYNAMVDAGTQLSRRCEWLSDATHLAAVLGTLAWPLDSTVEVHSCIALGNRVFNGYTCEGHPVRQVHEMQNVLERGFIEFSDGLRVRLWKDAAFATSDLVDYLKGNTTHADFVDAMVEVNVETPIGEHRLIFPTFALDLAQLKNIVLARYPAMA